jgi:hypothetical protein
VAQQEVLLRPLLSMAIFCEKVLKEADGVLSAIRIIDRINVRGTSDEMPPTPVHLCLVLAFKSGIMRGPGRVRLSPKSPSATPMAVVEFPVLFEGDDDRGVGIVVEMHFALTEQGLYWFDVVLLDETITRIPLRIVYQKSGSVIPGSS